MIFWTIFGIAAVLSVVGGVIMTYQIVRNHTITNLSDRVPWGLYIESFFLFSALGAGTLLFTAVVVFFRLEAYYTLAKLSSAFSISALVTAGVVLGADLGKPFRVLKMISGFNPASPLTWDFVTLSACIILNIVYLFDLITGELPAMVWAVLSVCAAISFVMLHSLFLTSRVEPGYRSQPFLALNTVIQSILGGVAVVNFLILYSGRDAWFFNKLLLVLIIFTLLITAVSQIGISGSGSRPQFDAKAIGLGLVILAILVYTINFDAGRSTLTTVVSALVLLSIFREKSHMVRYYQSHPVVPEPYSQLESHIQYAPSITEWALALGGLGICVLISQILFIIKNYPL